MVEWAGQVPEVDNDEREEHKGVEAVWEVLQESREVGWQGYEYAKTGGSLERPLSDQPNHFPQQTHDFNQYHKLFL